MAEVVEVSIGGCGADGMSSENAWDAGEESIYDPLYASGTNCIKIGLPGKSETIFKRI